jgi:hypothetical protein
MKVAGLNSDTNKGTTTNNNNKDTTTTTSSTTTTITTTTTTTTTTTITNTNTTTTTKGVILILVAIGTKFNTVVCGIGRSLNPNATDYDSSKYISIVGNMDTITSFNTNIEILSKLRCKKIPKGNPYYP